MAKSDFRDDYLITHLARTVLRLQRQLRIYAWHREDCAALSASDALDGYPCTCGLNELNLSNP